MNKVVIDKNFRPENFSKKIRSSAFTPDIKPYRSIRQCATSSSIRTVKLSRKK